MPLSSTQAIWCQVSSKGVEVDVRASRAELASLRIDHWERKLIQEALSRSDGNVPAAAKLLGIGRATLYRKIEEYGIER